MKNIQADKKTADSILYMVSDTEETVEVEEILGESYEASLGRLFTKVVNRFAGQIPAGGVYSAMDISHLRNH